MAVAFAQLHRNVISYMKIDMRQLITSCSLCAFGLDRPLNPGFVNVRGRLK